MKITQIKDLKRWMTYVQTNSGTILFFRETLTKNEGLWRSKKFLYNLDKKGAAACNG